MGHQRRPLPVLDGLKRAHLAWPRRASHLAAFLPRLNQAVCSSLPVDPRASSTAVKYGQRPPRPCAPRHRACRRRAQREAQSGISVRRARLAPARVNPLPADCGKDRKYDCGCGSHCGCHSCSTDAPDRGRGRASPVSRRRIPGAGCCRVDSAQQADTRPYVAAATGGIWVVLFH